MCLNGILIRLKIKTFTNDNWLLEQQINKLNRMETLKIKMEKKSDIRFILQDDLILNTELIEDFLKNNFQQL